jgi:hypothetical protein
MRPSIHALALLASLILGCAHAQPRTESVVVSPPSAIAPEDDFERELLRRLSSLPAEQPVSIDDATVTARAPYYAASGRTCRALTIQSAGQSAGSAARSRLVCREDSEWFFVPEVFRPEGAETSRGP